MRTDKYEIIFYVRACEHYYGYDTKEAYDGAKAFLDARLKAVPFFRNGQPVPNTDYYCVEDHQHAAFDEFVRWSARRSST